MAMLCVPAIGVSGSGMFTGIQGEYFEVPVSLPAQSFALMLTRILCISFRSEDSIAVVSRTVQSASSLSFILKLPGCEGPASGSGHT